MSTENPYGPPSSPVIAEHDSNFDIHLTLKGEVDQLRSTFEELMRSDRWTLTPDSDGWSGAAVRGKKWLNFLFGAFAQYHELRYSFESKPDGGTGLTVYRATKGVFGGVWGMMKVRKVFRATATKIEARMSARGALVAVGRDVA